MKAYVKSLDIFGHPLGLNLNQSKGPAHKTIYGGMISLIIKLTILFIFWTTLVDIFARRLDKTSSYEELRTSDEIKT